MQCRSCGTEIADKALICYRCGTPAAEAKFKPHVAARAASRSAIVLGGCAIVLLALLAWFLLHS